MTRILPKLIMLLFFALSACESAEERAERYYQSGLALLEAGDVDRALVEFRNVFAANPRHAKARLAYADAQRERGLIADAYGQYVRLIETDPDNVEALVALSEIAILSSGWEDAETYGRAVGPLAPEDDRVITVNAMLDYRDAVMTEEPAAVPAKVAGDVLARDPNNTIARKIVIDHAIMQGEIDSALETVEAGLDIDPNQPELHVIRVGLLSEAGDPAKTQAALEQMAAQFPENEQVQQELIAWYISRNDLSAAETYLRALATADDASETEKLTVVDFLRQTQGMEAARAELDRLIATEDDNSSYRALHATLAFVQGDQDAAIAEMEGIIAENATSDSVRDFKILLAQMLESQGNTAQAQTYVTEVLAEDAGHIDALKMQAGWAIADDDPNAAIIVLRQALAEAPRDVSLITLLGTAHERAGDHDLAGERYALAVEISNQGVEPSLRHANFLLGRNRLEAAEAVISSALSVAPQNIELLAKMGELQLRQGEWNKVTRIIWQLRAMDNSLAKDVADRTELALLNRQRRFDETRVFLEEMIADGGTSMAAKAQLIEAQIRAGRVDDARAFLSEELEKAPEDPTLRFLQADVHVLLDDPAAGEAGYRELLASFPENELVLGRLFGLLVAQDRQEDADAVLDDVLADAPDAMMANLVKASRLEATGDFDGAIAILENLYANDSSNLVVANNLASMITTRRDDDESVERAYAIAARMRGTDVPQFQDTLGWIAYRQGNFDEALTYLEPAARGLPNDALTHYHLGLTYLALERPGDARNALEKAITLGEGQDLPQMKRAGELLAELP